MVTFDSPIARCPRCRVYVLMDQTVHECAEEHGCREDRCPLGGYFEGREFRDPSREKKPQPKD